MKNKIIVFLLLGLLIIPTFGSAGVSDATSLMKEKTVSLGTHIVGIPMDVVGLAASTAWVVGEIVLFPFRWMAKPFRHKSPY